MNTSWTGRISFVLAIMAVAYALMVNSEKQVQDISRPQSACAITVFYKGGYGFGYDFRARVSAKGQMLALVYLGIYDLKKDINLDLIEFVDDSVHFKLYYGGEDVVVKCD